MIEKPYAQLLGSQALGKPWRTAAALLSCAAVTSLVCWGAYSHRLQEAREQLARQKHEREASRQLPQEPVLAANIDEALAAAELPWPQALAALEQIKPVGARVIAIELATRRRSLQLEVELYGDLTLATYLQQLNEATSAWQWVPMTTNSTDANARSAVVIARLRGRGDSASRP